MSGVWGTITDSEWTDDDARVVCRKLGYRKPGTCNIATKLAIANNTVGLPIMNSPNSDKPFIMNIFLCITIPLHTPDPQ